MSRWIRSVGDFLEKLDTGDEVEDDVLAARDFAKELKEQDFRVLEQDIEEPDNRDLELPADPETALQGVENVDSEEGLHDILLENQDFQTPSRTAESLEHSHLTPQTTNLKQYLTPAQFEEESHDADIDPVVGLSQGTGNSLNEDTNDSTSAQVQETLPVSLPFVDDGPLRELKALKAKLKSMEAEKGEITVEARKLRKHMVTLNEQLEAADQELEAQRKELLKAAESLELNRKQSASILSDTKSKHAASVREMEQKHAAAITALKQQHVQQQDDLRQELLMMDNQNQQHAGSLGKRLEQLEDENSKLAIERNDLLGQTRQLQSQYEALSSTIEDLQNRSEQYSVREIEYETSVEKQRAQIEQLTKQRNKDVQMLEEQVASLNMALAAAKSTAVAPTVKETARDDSAGFAADCEYWKDEYESLRSQFEEERKHVCVARQDLVNLRRKKELEAENLKREHAGAISELQERIESLESNYIATKRSPEDEHQQKALSDQILRQQEQLSQANVELSALRTRLSAALTRATIAEAAAEETREPIHIVPLQRRRKAHAVTLKQALGGGGTSVDVLDSFLAVTSKILRLNPYARLLFVLYLSILHLWTFALLVFHAHSSTVSTDPSHGPQAMIHALSLQKQGP